MKLLTANFLTCAVKSCKASPASFPLHFKDAVLERTEMAFNPLFITNILPRLSWDALRTTATELGLAAALPAENPSEQAGWGGKEGGTNIDGEEEARADGEEEDEEEEKEQEGRMEVEGTAVAGEGEAAAAAAKVSSGVTGDAAKEEVLKKLHGLLLETAVSEGKLVCGNCGFEYPIKDGVGNFLLPAHLV